MPHQGNQDQSSVCMDEGRGSLLLSQEQTHSRSTLRLRIGILWSAEPTCPLTTSLLSWS
jgi:hypothetical protein